MTITDTIDTTVVTLNDVAVLENGAITYTASVNNVPQTAFSVTLSNGVVINFAAGSPTGSSAPQPAQGDDVYQDGQSIPVSIASYSGGNYEAVNIADTATVTITDTIDTTVVTLNDVAVLENGAITYTASVNNVPQTAFSVTLSNGVVINFAAGSPTGSSAPQPAQGDDVYQDGQSIPVSIASYSGGNYEAVNIADTATVTITDTIDTTVVTLNDVAVLENGAITYTASVSNVPQTAFSVTLTQRRGDQLRGGLPDGLVSAAAGAGRRPLQSTGSPIPVSIAGTRAATTRRSTPPTRQR